MTTTGNDATPADQLPERLAARRNALGISQAEAAQRAHVTVRTWQRWETGATRAHFGHLPAMAEALETTPEQLLGAGATDETPRSLQDLHLEARLARIEAKVDSILAATRGAEAPPSPAETQRLLDESDELLQQEDVAQATPRARRARRK